ncbi:DUF5343 domain-containing protein [Marinobacterium sp. D7]|uniref:DUF5343 domain-containing protein n=1 Tax=Marinobacterium ramblicola TaxID=2849041 RepID=UPI001C2CC9A1|nr:DUF5343 domain-containing protein [Marinobacterium ramblicola]MBV1790796.1 DUF5343 domain-containing protein [Marinobacterium ramblicola]
MANGDVSFPKIADGNWWKLRELFKRKVPAVVTPTYLATALSMGEASARSNLVGPFKKIGIIDDDGKPTDLAYDWRDDHKYADVCKTLIENNYPQEIMDLFHSPDADMQQLTNWFMRHARCGEPAARMYGKFYLLLLKADLKEAENVNTKQEAKPKKAAPTKPKSNAKTTLAAKSETDDSLTSAQTTLPSAAAPAAPPVTTTVLGNAPELHINIQLHISPESSAEQIDKIFESMAKHLKDFNK